MQTPKEIDNFEDVPISFDILKSKYENKISI